MPFTIKRIYESYDPNDGWRVLVDRVWPRGASKEKAHLDEWCNELAPSTQLRNRFCHIPEKFDEFALQYRAELVNNPEIQDVISKLWRKTLKPRSHYFFQPEIQSTTRRWY